MIVILSPAKRIDENRRFGVSPSGIAFPEDTGKLAVILRGYSEKQLQEMMKISKPLAASTFQRFASWHFPPVEGWVHALAGFDGEVYNGLQAGSLTAEEIAFAQDHIRIVSGFYGLLRPLDAMLPYRLEMGTPLRTKGASDLYSFWKSKIARHLESDLSRGGDHLLINLASAEYSKAVVPYLSAKTKVISPVFQEFKQGKYTVVAVYAKRARGLMSRFILQNRLSDPEHLKAFDFEGYLYDPGMSDESRFVFTRKKV